MIKFGLGILTSLLSFVASSQNFGEFASAVHITACGNGQFWNITGSGANCINPTCSDVFDGHYYGDFLENSGELQLSGGEIKTWKNVGGNVCSGTLHYRVYTTGSTSGGFTPVSLPFKVGCCAGTFCDALGPCSGNDQKWSTEASTIDLTTLATGNYTLEVYFSFAGDNNSTSNCNDTEYISNGGSNYTATFDIVSSGGCFGSLAAEITTLEANCYEKSNEIKWTATPDSETVKFEIERSTDVQNWTSICTLDGLTAYSSGVFSCIDQNPPREQTNYYRLIEYTDSGNKLTLKYIALDCMSDEFKVDVLMDFASGEYSVFISNLNLMGELELNLIDASGRIVSSQIKTHSGSTKVAYKLETNKLQSGVYFLQVQLNSSVLDQVFVKL